MTRRRSSPSPIFSIDSALGAAMCSDLLVVLVVEEVKTQGKAWLRCEVVQAYHNINAVGRVAVLRFDACIPERNSIWRNRNCKSRVGN